MFLRHSIFFSFEMCIVKTVFIFILIELVFAQRSKPPQKIKPCKYNNDITVTLVPGLPPEENQYLLHIIENIPESTRVTLKFDSVAAITALEDSTATIAAANIQDHLFYLDFIKSVTNITLKVQGSPTGPIPHLTNFVINQGEYCTTPLKGYLDEYIKVNVLGLKACRYNHDITVTLVPGLPPEENQYLLHIFENIPEFTRVTLKFVSDAAISALDDLTATITAANIQNHLFYLELTKSVTNITLKVQGPPSGPIPHLTNLNINHGEYCNTPLKGYLDQYIKVKATTATIQTSTVNVVTTTTTEGTSTVTRYDSCGRRKVHHVELVVNGFPTKPGDWPWHAAIYRLDRARIDYICGGTLLSKFFILTAAHCVTLRGVAVLPESRNVILGKFNLVGGDIAPQEREVYQIVIHEGFLHTVLDNDIALMKLKSEAIYNDYVQPACLWHSDIINKIPEKSVHGTVVGWGFDQTDSLASTLQQVTVPIVSELKCIKSNPLFFVRLLNEQKFCAGHNNGSSACNGDSGGGFLVYVPDESGQNAFNAAAGTWFLRGIVSLGVSRSDVPICDPRQYVVFTDVSKFSDWLNTHMN